MLGKEAALFVPSGTMSNQLCLRTLTRTGDEVIVPRGRPRAALRGGFGGGPVGAAAPPAARGARRALGRRRSRTAIRPAGEHFARTGAVEMENTHNRCGGTIWPLEAMQAVPALARAHGIRVHLDGARLWNAHMATGVSLAEPTRPRPTRCRCASPRDWGLRWARRWPARGSSWKRRGTIASATAAPCGRPASSPRGPSTRWSTTSSAWWRTTRTRPAPGRVSAARCPGSSIIHPVQTNIVIADVSALGADRRAGGGGPQGGGRAVRRGGADPGALRHPSGRERPGGQGSRRDRRAGSPRSDAVEERPGEEQRTVPGWSLLSPVGPAADPAAPYARLGRGGADPPRRRTRCSSWAPGDGGSWLLLHRPEPIELWDPPGGRMERGEDLTSAVSARWPKRLAWQYRWRGLATLCLTVYKGERLVAVSMACRSLGERRTGLDWNPMERASGVGSPPRNGSSWPRRGEAVGM